MLQSYTQFNLWANEKFCEFLKALPEVDLHREITSSFSSVHKTVFHIYGAQNIWISRLHGTSPAAFPVSDSVTPSEALQKLIDTSKQLVSFIEHSTDESLQERIRYKNLAGEEFESSIWEIMQHVVNHGTYHRGQLVTMLRQLGHETLFPTDFIAFTRLPVPA